MKILIASDVYHSQINGVVISIDILVRELEAEGHDVRILTLSPSRKSKIDEKVYYNSSVSAVVYPNMRIFPRFNNEIRKDILGWEPELIHTQSEFSVFYFARQIAKKLNIPIVHTYHTLYQYYAGYVIPGKRLSNYVVKKYLRGILNKTNCVIVPTEKVRVCLENHSINPEIKIVPTGIVTRLPEKISEKRKKELKIAHHISEDKKIILSVGRIGKEKNLQELISYMPELVKVKPNTQLVIVGDGPYKNELVRMVKKKNLETIVLFVGMIPHEELNEIYQLGDLFVSASISETQGLTILEAMTNGLPLVCREDQSFYGTLCPGENGLFYQDKNTYLQGICKILNDTGLHYEFSKQSRRIASSYSTGDFAGKVETIYMKIVKDWTKSKIIDIGYEEKSKDVVICNHVFTQRLSLK
ncbi:MAG: glycosyltransferase [Lachnospiraceae bacterium]|nr:glycosyltransferase [Lachnospiraceae bacterium]